MRPCARERNTPVETSSSGLAVVIKYPRDTMEHDGLSGPSIDVTVVMKKDCAQRPAPSAQPPAQTSAKVWGQLHPGH